jgi:hypothetical protein
MVSYDSSQTPLRSLPIRIGVVFAAFPAKDTAPYKYFTLLLNHLQRSCEYELFDLDETDEFVRLLEKPDNVDGDLMLVNADKARDALKSCGDRLRARIRSDIDLHDLAIEQPDQIVVVSGVTLSDYHYLIRRESTTMLALGQWDRFMAPPSLAEFLQLLLLRAPYSALEGHVWNKIHMGNRACIFDFTENLENTRFMALAGVGVCANCEAALVLDGFPNAPAEIRKVAAREWRGDRLAAGTPANIMAHLGYDLFLTRGFEPNFSERLRETFSSDGIKEFIKFMYAVVLAWLIFANHWK